MKTKKEIYFVDSPKERKRLDLKFNVEQSKQELVDMGFKKGMSFLDVGSASGNMVRLVGEYDIDNKNIAGVDINTQYVDYCNEFVKKSKNQNIKYYVGNTYQLPFKDNQFDFIWSRFLLEHLKDPFLAIKEMKRVLKPSGKLAIGDIDGNCLFHYPIEEKFEKELFEAIELLKPFGFDPFIGRKLFHFMKQLRMKNIDVKIYPYHDIHGEPNKIDLENWMSKIKSVIDFIKKANLMDIDKANDIETNFIKLIKSKQTFTYSTLIFVRGEK